MFSAEPGDILLFGGVDKGITVGTDATHFSPNMGTTRAQVVTFLYRYMK